MKKETLFKNQQTQAKDTRFLPLQDDQNVPITQESLSHNQHRMQLLRVAPPFAPPLGSMSPMGDAADGLNMPFNQSPMRNRFEPNPQTQGHIGNHNEPRTDHVAQNPNPNSKGPINAPFREHDLYMPVANVVRIMRRGLPPHAKVADEAKEMVQECVSEFISFITSEANEVCQLERRKTITAEDIIVAMSRLGFEHYLNPLSTYLQRYRESEMLPIMARRGIGHHSNEVSAITSTTNVLPPFSVVHPTYGNFVGNGGTYQGYHDGSGTSSGSMNMGGSLDLDTANVCNGNGPNSGLQTGDGPNDSEEASPSGQPQTGVDFYHPYGQ